MDGGPASPFGGHEGSIICAVGLMDDEGRMRGLFLSSNFVIALPLVRVLMKELYVEEGVWQKIEVENVNVGPENGEKRM